MSTSSIVQYRPSSTSRLPPPLPTATELVTAITTLSLTLQTLRIKHGLISSSAIFLHATSFLLPCLLPTTITILIQPSPKLSAPDLPTLLCEKRFRNDFVVTRKDGVDISKVIVRRKDDIRGDLFVAFKVVDHWTCWDRRDFYDFRLSRNHTVSIIVGPDAIHILNPAWLLRQQIQIWNARTMEAERRKDEREIRTLVDVLEFRKEGKIRVSGKRDVDDLRMLVMGMREDDPGVFRGVVDCPEVFGPWWRDRSIWGLVVLGAFVLAVLADLADPWDDGLPVE